MVDREAALAARRQREVSAGLCSRRIHANLMEASRRVQRSCTPDAWSPVAPDALVPAASVAPQLTSGWVDGQQQPSPGGGEGGRAAAAARTVSAVAHTSTAFVAAVAAQTITPMETPRCARPGMHTAPEKPRLSGSV